MEIRPGEVPPAGVNWRPSEPSGRRISRSHGYTDPFGTAGLDSRAASHKPLPN